MLLTLTFVKNCVNHWWHKVSNKLLSVGQLSFYRSNRHFLQLIFLPFGPSTSLCTVVNVFLFIINCFVILFCNIFSLGFFNVNANSLKLVALKGKYLCCLNNFRKIFGYMIFFLNFNINPLFLHWYKLYWENKLYLFITLSRF